MTTTPHHYVTRSTIRTTAFTRTVQWWVGKKRESFVWEGIQRCRSSQTRTLTTCFNGSLSMTHTAWYRTDLFGLTLTLVMLSRMIRGNGSMEINHVRIVVFFVITKSCFFFNQKHNTLVVPNRLFCHTRYWDDGITLKSSGQRQHPQHFSFDSRMTLILYGWDKYACKIVWLFYLDC